MATPSDKPGWLHLSLRLANRDADYIADRLGVTKGTSAAGTARGGNLPSRRAVQALTNILRGIVNGIYEGNLWLGVTAGGGAFGTATITPTYANGAGDSLVFTYAGLAITLVEGVTASKEGFARGASLATQCAAIVAAINAHPVLGGLVLASTNSTVVTLTSKTDGATAPFVLSTNDGTAYAFAQFSGGTTGTARLYRQHILSNRLP